MLIKVGGLGIGKHVNLNRFDRFSLTVDHPPDFLGCFPAERRLTAMFTDSGRNVFNQDKFSIDEKNLINQFFSHLLRPTDMALK